ncbi:hypothetical protein AZE42_10637 [Rhizopogon vesiculosus]|uniref:Uncharacterized protein n=1 Tax=Rhizopogon vesiculosus TaxID=180088 RepID=A0A1J8PQJ8_9AGAM|nr:hypothetical protein AZE42_10637 [Rhizopogon vesiculosus]
MTIVSNDPSWWPIINSQILSSYSIVICFSMVVYDWGEQHNTSVEIVDSMYLWYSL